MNRRAYRRRREMLKEHLSEAVKSRRPQDQIMAKLLVSWVGEAKRPSSLARKKHG